MPGRRGGSRVAVEIKRRGDIDGVEQLTRYLELMNRDPHSPRSPASSPPRRSSRRRAPWPQDRGIRCVVLDYDALRGIDDTTTRLF